MLIESRPNAARDDLYGSMCRQCGETVRHHLRAPRPQRCRNGHDVAPTLKFKDVLFLPQQAYDAGELKRVGDDGRVQDDASNRLPVRGHGLKAAAITWGPSRMGEASSVLREAAETLDSDDFVEIGNNSTEGSKALRGLKVAARRSFLLPRTLIRSLH